MLNGGSDVEVLLTTLSVLAVWTLLVLLTIALMLIRQPLKRTRIHLERIAMGVRAIEQQVTPLRGQSKNLTGLLGDANRGLSESSSRLKALDQSLKTAFENDLLR